MSAELTTIPLQFDSPSRANCSCSADCSFGVTLAFMGLNHFMDVDTMAGYAEFKGSRRRASR